MNEPPTLDLSPADIGYLLELRDYILNRAGERGSIWVPAHRSAWGAQAPQEPDLKSIGNATLALRRWRATRPPF